MIDIKSLFLAAKNSGAENDVKAYIEAVDNVINASPRDYVLQLEYIIQSSAGINTLIPFIEKWGMPIALYDTIYECVSECIDKAEAVKADTTAYTEAKKYLEEFRLRNIHGFVMYEFYRPDDVTDYIKTYYGFTKEHQNRFLAAGMIKKFGEYAIPDALITAKSLNGKAVTAFHEFVNSLERTALENEFLKECYAENGIVNDVLMNESASTIINSMHADHHEVFREAMIMGDEDYVYEYDQKQIDALQDLISYYEYMLTWADETRMDVDHTQKMLIELCEEAEAVQKESDANLVEMLPQAKMEAPAWLNQTSDKKHSTVAPYLKRNHDISTWGENDPKHDTNDSKEDDGIDKYRRPANDEEEPDTADDEPNEDSVDDELHPPKTTDPSGITNYYYYTYQNSLNKNDHSFNDQSSGKHINSHNGKIPEQGDFDKYKANDAQSADNKEDIPEDESVKESVEPWKLELGVNELFKEAANPIGEAAKDDSWSDDEDEEVSSIGDADKDKPQSDHPVKDIFMDIDRKLGKVHQGAKKGVQNVVNVGKAFVKPAKRTKQWVDSMITSWNDTKETNVKERLANPKERAGLITALRESIKNGALFKAGLLLNPIILGLRILSHKRNSEKEKRLKNEMILELQQEQEIIKEKIKDAESKNDYQAKYQLMRFQTELRKKLWRVSGNKNVVNMI